MKIKYIRKLVLVLSSVFILNSFTGCSKIPDFINDITSNITQKDSSNGSDSKITKVTNITSTKEDTSITENTSNINNKNALQDTPSPTAIQLTQADKDNGTINKDTTTIKKPASAPANVVRQTESSGNVTKISDSIKTVNTVVAQQSDLKPSSDNVQTVSTLSTFENAIVSGAESGNDFSLVLQGQVSINDIGNKIIQTTDKTGYSGYINSVVYGIRGNSVAIHFDYKDGKVNFLTKISSVKSKVTQIIGAVIKPGMTDFAKELAIHDYLVNSASYDKETALPNDSFTAYGALVKKVAVCEGYAEAMYRLLNEAGVNTLIIDGTSGNVPHAWNLVNIGGLFYHLDSTFDDPISSRGNILSYSYFNLTDAQISKNHNWDSVNYPKCTSNAANYFVVNKLYVSNSNDFYNIIKNGLLNKQNNILCQTSTYDPITYKRDMLYKVLQDNPDITYLSGKSKFSYWYDPDSSVFEFSF